MSDIMEEASTHTGRAFQEFAFDLLEYAIPKCNYKWTRPADSERMFKKIFKDSFGHAVILYRNRHKEEFQERIDRYFRMDSDADIEKYSENFCERTFRGEMPLMELIAYFAFLLDTSLSYLRVGEPTEVLLLTDDVFGVFYLHVQSFFTIVGGWHALFRVAEQYVDFMNFIPASIASESASEVSPVSKI